MRVFIARITRSRNCKKRFENSKLVGKKISKYQQFREDLRWPIPPNMKELIEGAIIKSI